MHINDFSYHRPSTLAEASDLGRRLGPAGFFLAGGTELYPDLFTARVRAEHLIDLSHIGGLGQIRDEAGELVVGALASLSHIAGDPLVRARFPALAEAATTVAGTQIRNQATIGGNFCRAVPCADTPPICIAGEAAVKIHTAGRDRVLPAATFFTGARQTVLEPGDLLTEIRIPPQPAGSGATYERFSLRRGSALAVAAVAARVVIENGTIAGARVVLGAVAPTPLLTEECGAWLQGREPTPETFGRAAEIAASEARPITDIRGTAAFRRKLVGVLTRRALEVATHRAGHTI